MTAGTRIVQNSSAMLMVLYLKTCAMPCVSVSLVLAPTTAAATWCGKASAQRRPARS